MPRSVSWPVSRTGTPSSTRDAERERLGLRPVDPALLAERLAPPLELARELRVDGEAVGHREELLVQRLEALLRDGGLGLLAAGAPGPALLARACDAPASSDAFSASWACSHALLHLVDELPRPPRP